MPGCVWDVWWTVSNGSVTWLPTGVSSDYLTGPGTITYTKTKSLTTTWTGGASLGATFKIWVIELNPSVSYTYSRATTNTETFSYTLDVPSGQTDKLEVFKEAVAFTARKYENNTKCQPLVAAQSRVVAPVTNDVYAAWRVEL